MINKTDPDYPFYLFLDTRIIQNRPEDSFIREELIALRDKIRQELDNDFDFTSNSEI